MPSEMGHREGAEGSSSLPSRPLWPPWPVSGVISLSQYFPRNPSAVSGQGGGVRERRAGTAPRAQTEGQGQTQARGLCRGQLTVRKDTGQGLLPLQSGWSKFARGRMWDSESPLVGQCFFRRQSCVRGQRHPLGLQFCLGAPSVHWS